MRAPQWFGLVEGDDAGAAVSTVADLAKAGQWVDLITLLKERLDLHPNMWRPGGTSLYTPLHQAAWHGAPVEVVAELIGLGAFRTLRTADGKRAIDIANEHGHQHLLDLLQPPVYHAVDKDVLPRLEQNLVNVIEDRIRPDIKTRLRHPPVEVLTEFPQGELWYPVPGMYGGFSISLRENHLYTESWTRVVEGSGRGHVITKHGAQLVRQGFV